MTTLELNPIPTAQEAQPAPSLVDIVGHHIENGTDVSELTALYLKLRGAKADLENQAKERLAPIKQGLELIESHFLTLMLDMKVDSLKNEAGTPYKSEVPSVTVADNAAFIDFVLSSALEGLQVSDQACEAIKNHMIESGQLALLEARASKSAVEAFLEETKELPPGLNRRVDVRVNVRAS